jgi:hypothetical protein
MTQHTPPTAYSISARYGLHRSLSPLGLQADGCRHYILWGYSVYTRGGHGMIDFEGGPFVSTGEFLNPDAPQPVWWKRGGWKPQTLPTRLVKALSF